MIIFGKSLLSSAALVLTLSTVMLNGTPSVSANETENLLSSSEETIVSTITEDGSEETNAVDTESDEGLLDSVIPDNAEEQIRNAVDSLDGEKIASEVKSMAAKVSGRQAFAKNFHVDDDQVSFQWVNEASFIKLDNNGKIHSAMPYGSEVGENDDTTIGKLTTFILDLGAGGLEAMCAIINAMDLL